MRSFEGFNLKHLNEIPSLEVQDVLHQDDSKILFSARMSGPIAKLIVSQKDAWPIAPIIIEKKQLVLSMQGTPPAYPRFVKRSSRYWDLGSS